jgi:hypothetical protein
MILVSKINFLNSISILNIVFRIYSGINPQLSLKSNYVMLSSSVGVTMPKKFERTSCPIQISDLEHDYKARYKSDYFSQDGKVRPPRYVADRSGNHFVSIKVRELKQKFSFIYYLYLLFCSSHRVPKVIFESIG